MHGIHYLSTFFVTILCRDKSWTALSSWFTNTGQPTPSSPELNSSKPIFIPCHVNGAHWIGVVRRIVNDKVYFFYADDLNHPPTESAIRHLFDSYANNVFYPRNAKWIRCKSITYRPHSNECGPRTLLALTIMGLHPQPDKHILLPYMNGNLAKIARTWVATSLMTDQVVLPELTADPYAQLSDCSKLSYLFPWNGQTNSITNHPPPNPPQTEEISVKAAGTIGTKLTGNPNSSLVRKAMKHG